MVGNPHRAQISQFELFDFNFSIRVFVGLILLLKLNKQFPVEQFEATLSQSAVPSPLSEVDVRDPTDRCPFLHRVCLCGPLDRYYSSLT